MGIGCSLGEALIDGREAWGLVDADLSTEAGRGGSRGSPSVSLAGQVCKWAVSGFICLRGSGQPSGVL